MKSHGIALHAITAESGGDAAVLERLKKRKVEELPFPVHSDADHRLLMVPPEGHYMFQDMPASKKFGSEFTDYNMVQPAMEVLDRAGAVVQKWSWYSLKPPPTGEGVGPVLERPITTDIVPSIKEGRNVRFASLSKCAVLRNIIRSFCC